MLFDRTASPQHEFRLDWDAEVTDLSFYPWPPSGLRELALPQDLIVVGGRNTANMLAVWRTHGFDRILREAWEKGILLTGWSAGMICWFEAGVPAGVALDDGAGAHFVGAELHAVVAADESSRGYAVMPEGERSLETKVLRR